MNKLLSKLERRLLRLGEPLDDPGAEALRLADRAVLLAEIALVLVVLSMVIRVLL